MSMISAQSDELRSMAASVGLEVPQAATLMMGAADSIDRLDAENAKLRELCGDMMWTIRHAHGYFKNDTHEMLMTYVRGRDGKPTHVAHSLTCDEEEYERRMTELGVDDAREQS